MGTGWIPTAQAHSHGHKGQRAQNRTTPDTPAVHEYKAAHARMMRDMALPFTGNPDVDFRMHMIPHHQGAIDMVNDLFKAYGAAQDDTIYKFASDVFADQTIEIDVMNKMLETVRDQSDRRP